MPTDQLTYHDNYMGLFKKKTKKTKLPEEAYDTGELDLCDIIAPSALKIT